MRNPVALLFLAALAFGLVAHAQNSPQTQVPATQPQTTQSKPTTPPKGHKRRR